MSTQKFSGYLFVDNIAIPLSLKSALLELARAFMSKYTVIYLPTNHPRAFVAMVFILCCADNFNPCLEEVGVFIHGPVSAFVVYTDECGNPSPIPTQLAPSEFLRQIFIAQLRVNAQTTQVLKQIL